MMSAIALKNTTTPNCMSKLFDGTSGRNLGTTGVDEGHTNGASVGVGGMAGMVDVGEGCTVPLGVGEG